MKFEFLLQYVKRLLDFTGLDWDRLLILVLSCIRAALAWKDRRTKVERQEKIKRRLARRNKSRR